MTHFLRKWIWEIFSLGAEPWLRSAGGEHVSEASFLQEHWHGTFTEVIIIQLQFCQQGPIRYNSRVSSYNPRAVRRDAGRQLPDTWTVQRLSPTVRPRFSWCATPVLNLLPYTGQWRLMSDSDQARYSFIHVFPILQFRCTGNNWFDLLLRNTNQGNKF